MASTLWIGTSFLRRQHEITTIGIYWPERVFSSLTHTPPRAVFIWDPGVAKLQWLIQKSLLVSSWLIAITPLLPLQGLVGFLANRRRHVSLCVGLCVFAVLSWEIYHHRQCWGGETNSSFIMPSALCKIVAGMSIVSCRTAFNEGKA